MILWKKMKDRLKKSGMTRVVVFFPILLMGAQPLYAETVASGQNVEVSFSCRLASGELVSSTDKSAIAEKDADPLALFIGPGNSEKTVIRVGDQPLSEDTASGDKLRDFMAVLKNGMAGQMAGMKKGETRKIVLSADDTPELEDKDRYLQMAKQRSRPKMRHIPLSMFKKEEGGEIPDVGKDMTREVEPWLKGVVTAKDDEAITVAYSAENGKTVDTPFGPGVISETADKYILTVSPAIGKLVRAGGFIGKIVSADDKNFTVDFGNPFGGEKIYCDLTADEIVSSQGEDLLKSPALLRKETEAKPGSDAVTSGSDAAALPAGKNHADLSPKSASDGDIAALEFSLFNQSGELVMTNRKADDRNVKLRKGEEYQKPQHFEPAEIVLGKKEVISFIENAVYGMKSGERKKIHIDAKDAYGDKDPDKVKTFPRIKAIPETIRMTKEEFKKQFGAEAEKGEKIKVVPLFDSEVASVENDMVSITHLVETGASVPGDIGFTRMERKEGKVVMTLTPIPGAEFKAPDGSGMVSGMDDQNFTVDFNPPHAGESFGLDLTVKTLVKNGTVPKDISMKTDLDATLKAIGTEHKPAVLVLYASWCPWCKRLFNETLTDPRVTSRAGRFIWAKIDSDKAQDIYKLYNQNGFPAVVFLKKDGSVAKKLDGFSDAPTLARELRAMMEKKS